MIFFGTRKSPNSKYNETKKVILDTLAIIVNSRKDLTGIPFMPPISYLLIKTFSKKKGREYKLDTLEFNWNVKSFLNNLNFFSEDMYISVDNVTKIETLNQRWDEEDIWNHYSEVFSRYVKEESKLLKYILKIIWEALNNVIDHSWWFEEIDNVEPRGGMLYNYTGGQYFKRWDFLQIAIVDWGIWIFSSLKKWWIDVSSTKDAISKSLEVWISWWNIRPKQKNYSQYFNRGIGLTTTKEIIKLVKGDLFIGTKDALYCYDGSRDKEEFEDISNNIWGWTFLAINIYSKEEISDYEDLERRILESLEKDIRVSKKEAKDDEEIKKRIDFL